MEYLHIRTMQTISDLELLVTVEDLEAGYYVPATLPELSAADLKGLGKLPLSERVSHLLLHYFPSFSAKELYKLVKKHYGKLDTLPDLKPFNHYMPVYLAELDKLSTGSIYDYILPLLLDLQVAALQKRNDEREIVLLEHNLGNSSFSALVKALEELNWPKITLYYNPKRIDPQIHKSISDRVEHVKLKAVDNALSLPTINLFASRLNLIKAQLAKADKHLESEQETEATLTSDNTGNLASDYPAPTLSTLDSLPAVLIASCLQLALLASLPLAKQADLWPQIEPVDEADDYRRNKDSQIVTPKPEPKKGYRTVNLFLPAKQGYLLLAACYSKIICPVVGKIYLAGKRGNMLSELVRFGNYEVKGKHNTFELPVQLERMLFEFNSRDNQRSIALLNDFARKGTLQLPLVAKHNINGVVLAELYTDKNEAKLMLNLYDRFDLMLPPLSVLAFAVYLKYYENINSTDELGLVFVNASIFRYPEQVANALYADKVLQGHNFVEIMQALSLEACQVFPDWFLFEHNIKADELVSLERFDPEQHKAEFEKIRLEGLSEEEKANLV